MSLCVRADKVHSYGVKLDLLYRNFAFLRESRMYTACTCTLYHVRRTVHSTLYNAFGVHPLSNTEIIHNLRSINGQIYT